MTTENALQNPQSQSSTTASAGSALASRVMIVDDEPVNIKVARKYLQLAGYQNFIITSDSAAAMETIRRELPDVILLDVMMPGIDGVATMQCLSADPETSHIPVIFLTAKAQIGDRRRLDGAGACGLIAKPFDPMRLAHDVEVILSANPQ